MTARAISLVSPPDEEIAQTTVEQATRLIRGAIVTNEFRPGERIKVVDIASRFGFSAMPVREALRKLEGEGLVAIVPNRGAIVRPIDAKFLEDVYDVRTALEILALERLIPIMTLNKLDALIQLQAVHVEAVERGDLEAIVGANRDLHVKLFEMAGNREATRLYELGWELIHALRLRCGYSLHRLDVVIEEHRQLLEGLRRQDVVACNAVMRMHNRAGLEDILASLAT